MSVPILEVQEYQGLNREQLLLVNDASHDCEWHSKYNADGTWSSFRAIDYHIAYGSLCSCCEQNIERLKAGKPFIYKRRIRTRPDGTFFLDRPEGCEIFDYTTVVP